MGLRNANQHADIRLARPCPLAEVADDGAHVTSGECFDDLRAVPETRGRRWWLVSSGAHGSALDPRRWRTSQRYTLVRSSRPLSSKPGSALTASTTLTGVALSLSLSPSLRELGASSLMEIPSASAIATATERTGWLC